MSIYSFNVSAEDSKSVKTITLQLKWKHAFQFAGYYAAIEQGYYHDAGLKVKLLEHGGEKSPVTALLEKDVEYAVIGSQVVVHRAAGKPLVVLASIFQHDPLAFLVKEKSGIRNAENFKGKRLMILDDGVQNASLLATLRRAGLVEDDYQVVPMTFDPFALTRGEADVFSAYVSDQGFALDEAGIKNRYILPKQYGVDFYGDVLVTTEGEAQTNPDRVNAFLDASLEGWKYALEKPDEIIDLILEKYNTQGLSRAHLEYEARISRELIQPLLVKVGHTNPARWDHIREVFEELGFIPMDSNISGMVYGEHAQEVSGIEWFQQNWLLVSSTAILTFIFGLLIFNYQLRRQVEQRTSELVESEQHWRALINAEPACVKTLNKKGEVLTMNESGLAMIEADSIDQVLGKQVQNMVDAEYRDKFIQLCEDVFEGKTGSLLFKATGLQGKEVWLETVAVPFTDIKGNVLQCLEVTQDVTERIMSEDENKRLQHELQMAQKMEALGHLTGGIAHDFNNLLGVIIGYSSLVLAKSIDGDEKLKSYMENVLHSGERAKSLVEQMLAFSRGDDIETNANQLEKLITGDIRILRSALPSSIEIETEIESDLPAVVLGPTQLNQIIMNLSINARDAMNGKGTLGIRLGMATDLDRTCNACLKHVTGDWVEIAISDTGTGIDEQVLKNIFNPFFTTKEVGKGTGMGLSVIFGIVRAHDGHIIVDTEAGKGTTFHVLLRPSTLDPVYTEISREIESQTMPVQNIKVLVVDDESPLADLIGELLQEHGYQVTVVYDSVEALAKVEQHPDEYDLLVTDQTMPGLTGIELVEEIRSIKPQFPVVLCTGFSDHIDEFSAMEHNISYMSKPVDATQLLQLVSLSTSKNQMFGSAAGH